MTWLVLLTVGVALAAGIVLWGEVERRRFQTMLKEAVDDGTEQMGQEMAPHPAALQAARAVDEDLHQKYEGLAETDPRLAGRLKYAEQLARHGT